MDTTTAYSWVPYFEKLADALLPYADNRQELIQKLWASFKKHKCLPKLNKAHTQPDDIDPFTVFSVFCIYNLKSDTRLKYLQAMAEVLGVDDSLPTDFEGISCTPPKFANFYSWGAPASDCDNLWAIFKAALQYAGDEQKADEFMRLYDVVLKQKGILWKITTGLFWIRPEFYVSLDSTHRDFIAANAFYKKIKPQIWKPKEKAKAEKAVPLTGEEYVSFCEDCRELLKDAQAPYHTIPELSAAAWKDKEDKEDNKAPKTPQPSKKGKKSTPPSKDVNPDGSMKYAQENFLREVFMPEKKYKETVEALKYKYNIILQGPPGVGKSYAAKRLAYSLMGERDDERICMIQFHHSYSYEDFMQGYRPNKNGKFTLRNGIFYNFCEKAKRAGKKEHYLIIDEINRGDLNKIFGETFLLMEKDKRGTDSVKLAYSPELGPFTIPKNIRIIGMMNTADRSIALIDHALRRRFAFIDLEPAYDDQKFKNFVQNGPSAKLQSLLEAIRKLNKEITEDSSLGKGYRIGHSYFCPPDPEELTDERLNAIVKFELIPLLEEYWFDEPDKVNGWSEKLEAALQ